MTGDSSVQKQNLESQKKPSHWADGRVNMVDVSHKPESLRRALAEARVRVSPELAEIIQSQSLFKGDLFTVASLAGIQAAKRTGELIPLCHNLPLDWVDVRVTLRDLTVVIEAEVHTTGRTGVEMEALTAAAVAALAVIDMGKSVDREMVIESVRLLEKSGGQHGDYRAPEKREQSSQ
jgi:cyclic pyranopterin phosphate synthase